MASLRPSDSRTLALGGSDASFALPDVLAIAVLSAAVWALYGATGRLWWTHDDLFHVHVLLTHSPRRLRRTSCGLPGCLLRR